MNKITQNRITTYIYDTFPNCPGGFVKQFLESLAIPSVTLLTKSKFTLEKPYGANHIIQDEGVFGFSWAQLKPGHSTSLHYHQKRRELFCVRQGLLKLTKGDRVQMLRRFDCNCSTPNQSHSLSNPGQEWLEIIEIFSPALLNDKIRLKDRYKRQLGEVKFDQ